MNLWTILPWIGIGVLILGSLWYFWLCSGYVAELCQVCKEEIRQEREVVPVLVQASPDMSAEQLADLLREAQALLQAEPVA